MDDASTWQGYISKQPGVVGGEPCISGTRVTVRGLVELWRTGTPPEDIPLLIPHVTLAQVFAALSYYADHRAEILHHIEANRVPDELVHPLARGEREGASGAKRAAVRDRLP